MRDIISNDTLAQIAETVDEILDRMDSNTKRIEMPENIIDGDKVLFSYRQYNGVLNQVKVNDVNIIISDYTLDELLSDVHMQLKISKNKYVYVNIADKGFRMHGGSIEERTPTNYDVWIPELCEFTNNGYAGSFTRDYYVPSEHTNIQYVQYLLVGLTVGEEYTFTFKSKIALHHSGTSVEWRDNPYGLLFAYDSTIDHEVVDALPHDSGVWHSDVNFQSFYRDEQEHTYTCTITPEYSYMNITFIFDGVNSWDGYKSFTWSRFRSNKGINILDKEICFEGTWYNLGTSGGGGTSDLDAIELTYAEYQALTPAEKTDPDKIYFITDYPSGSGVVINPTGTATDTAETIEVDGTIYDFAGTDADAIHTADIGVAGGVAELDANGKVPSSQLPSYVDDVVEYASISTFPATGESGKIYIALDTNKTYRWTGSVYVEISPSLALGETSSTAYRGDRGKTAYDHSQSDHSGIAPAFTEASTRANIASGETFATLLGKIKKFFSDLKTVAFTGAYSDLSGTPTIPTVNNGTLTIKRNNTSVGTFTANQSGASNINIECATPSDVEGSKTATGSIVTVTDAADIYAEEVGVAVECTQTGSGTPSPSNIRPIQGYDIVSVDRCGKNLFGDFQYGYTTDSSGKIIENANSWICKLKCDNTKEKVYLKIFDKGTYTGSFWIKYSLDGETFTNIGITSQFPQISNGYTTNADIPQGTKYLLVGGYMSSHGTNHNIASVKAQVEYSAVGDTYEPLNKQTVSLQLGNKNLLPMTVEGIKAANTSGTWSGNAYTHNGVTFTILTDENGLVTEVKTNSATVSGGDARLFFPITDLNGKYIMNGCTGGSSNTYRLYLFNSNYSIEYTNYSGDTSMTISNGQNLNFIIYIKNGATIGSLSFKPMIRDANVTDPTFSPYNPSLGGMVYGGQLTIKDDGSAVFVGDRACVDLGSLEWSYSRIFYFNGFTQAKLPSSSSQIANIISSVYKAVADNDVLSTNGAISLGTTGQLCVNDSRYTSVSDFKTAVTGQTLVYELATPFTLHLSAEQLKLLQGTNNVWSNAGNVTLKYQPDNVIAEPKADVQRLRDDVDDRLVGNACKNLFNKNGTQTTTYGTATIDGEKITCTGTYYCQIDMPLKADVFTVSAKVKSYGATHGFRLLYEDGSTSSMADSMTVDTNGKNVKALLLYCGTGTSATTVYQNVQVERGSSPTAYEEYYPSNRELANLVDSSLVKCNPTTDYADRSHYIDISAYDDNKPIFGYVYLAKGAYIRYCPVWLMKDWGTDEPSNTIITAHVTSYFKFTFYYNNSPRRVMLAEVKDYNDDDVSGYNAIRLYLYRNY